MESKKLNNKSIKEYVNELSDFLEPLRIKKHNRIWLQLALEEILLKYKDNFGEKTTFSYSFKKKLTNVVCELEVNGEELDVLHPQDSTESDSNVIDHIFDIGPGEIYYSRNKANVITAYLSFDKPLIRLPGSSMLHAIVLALIVGLVSRFTVGDKVTYINDSYLSPIYSTLMNTLKGITEPVIFISLIAGICAIGDLHTMNSIGKKILLSFFKISTIMVVMGVAVCLFAFKRTGTLITNFDPSKLVELLLQSLPDDIFTPFTNSNMIQIVLLGFVIGIIILRLGNKVTLVKNFILELKLIFNRMLEVFTKILPVVVFLSIVISVTTLQISDSMVIWKLIIIDQGLELVLVILLFIYTSFKTNVPIKALMKNTSSAFGIALSTGSSTAVIPELYKCLPDKLGIDNKFSDYFIPLSNSFFSPSTIFALIVYSFYAAECQGITPTFVWIFILYVMIIQIGMATPRIPGGIIASVAILFSQLGLTTDQIGIIMSANIIILYFDTAVATVIRTMGATCLAKKEGYLDISKIKID